MRDRSLRAVAGHAVRFRPSAPLNQRIPGVRLGWSCCSVTSWGHTVLGAVLGLLGCLSGVAAGAAGPWGVAAHPWPETLGSIRARVAVEVPAEAVRVHLPWRRRDLAPEKKNVVVMDLATGKPVANVVAVRLSREAGDLVFAPATVPGEYGVYYLPCKHTGPTYFPSTAYDAPRDTAEPAWRGRFGLTPDLIGAGGWRQLPEARVLVFEARSEFDRVDPMEVIATADELSELRARHGGAALWLFPEDRRFPIRMTDDLPWRWVSRGPTNRFQGDTRPGEFYTFQVGVYAALQTARSLSVSFGDLVGGGNAVIGAAAIRCFNQGGTNWLGRAFTTPLTVSRGQVQALWFGVAIPMHAAAGPYRGTVIIRAEGLPEEKLELTLGVGGEPLADAGDSEVERQARLRWLDSTVGLDHDVVAPYRPIVVDGRSLSVLGRTVHLADTGLPAAIASTFSDSVDRADAPARAILARPIRLIAVTAAGPIEWHGGQIRMIEAHAGSVCWESRSRGGDLGLVCRARLDADGYLDTALHLTAGAELDLLDVQLEIPLRREAARYMMGLGCKGGYRPATWKWTWNAELNNHRVWLGDVNAGLHCKLKGAEDSWELYNLKASGLPESWHNGGRGGADVSEETSDTVRLRFGTGARRVQPGQEVVWRFGLMATPVKTLDPVHWNVRYWHACSPVAEVARHGANVINIHHANELNPFINYPFVATDKLKPYVDEAHRRGIKVKLYYTIRELSSRAAELWALRSLGAEVFRQGPGFHLADSFASSAPDKGDATTGNAWLCEHLITGYVPAWHHPFGDGVWDAAIATTGLSRWHNYYLEGLGWLIRNIGVDGIYLDGIGYDRGIMKRVRKVMDRARPGCLIDFHCGNHFAPEYGLNCIVNQHREHRPYIDSRWLGEGFNYDESPEYWLVELSGIPFGLFGEMLGVGNPWRGMLYGMSNRLPYGGGDPRPLWKLWDSFRIQEARLFGYWHPACPVATSQANILASAYVRTGQSLIALASWAPEPAAVTLSLDWKALGLDPKRTALRAPPIEHFQTGAVFAADAPIQVQPGKGWLLVAEESRPSGP